MIEFNSLGSYKSYNFGRQVFLIECPYDLDRDSVIKHFKGNEYLIDGVKIRVVGVELNLANTGVVKKGEKIGLATDIY